MLRSIDSWDSEHFAFNGAESPLAAAASTIAVDNGPDGPTATIPDAHLLFTAQFSRAGADLVLQGEDGKIVAVHDYFASDVRARLLSPEGAALSPDVVAALAGPLAPGQFAQAGAPQTNVQAVGRVAQVEGGATIIRNGVAMQANTGDAILKGDVLQTVTGSLGVTFNDGSTLNITANSRLVVNEFVYDPKGSQNSQLLDLVQGSLTFISGEVAHSGDMKIGTPVATMGIRGTVGGVTTANDGTVRFYVSQSATGAVILDSRGTIIANVVQDGPLIVVRPVGPLQVLAEELQKSPAQLATELAALQHIVSIKSVGDQLIQQFFQQNPTNNPNPQSTDHPHTQIPDTQIDLKPDPLADNGNNNDGYTPPVTAIVTIPPSPPTPGNPPPDPDPIIVTIPANLPPINFGPLTAAMNEDQTLTFTGQTAVSVFDADTGILTVTLGATHGVLTLGGNAAGLTFAAGDGTADAAMVFSGTQAAINAALNGMKFTPDADYNGNAEVTIAATDGNNTTATNSIAITVNAVNDAPVVTPGTAIISEEGLCGGIADSAGDPDTTNCTTASGTIVATDAEGDSLTFSLGTPSTALTSNDVPICWELCGDNTLTGVAGQATVITIEIDPDTGAYMVTLAGPIDHPDGCAEDIKSFDVPVNVTDGADTTTSSLTITVEDDSPHAIDSSATVTSGAASAFSTAFALDYSGSIDDTELNAMLGAVKIAAQAIFANTSQAAITVVAFAATATTLGTYSDYSAFAAAIDGTNPSLQGSRPALEGGTNFDAAIQQLVDHYSPIEGAKNEVFFLSDGQSSVSSTATAWQNFVTSHHINVTAVGIGDQISNSGLQSVDVDGSGAPILVGQFSDLVDSLLSLVGGGAHNIFHDGETTDAGFGADSGHIASIEIDGVIYSWDGESLTKSDGECTVDLSGSSISVETELGGRIDFYFAADGGHSAGDWSYKPPASLTTPTDEVFHYVLADNDGDTSGADITVAVTADNYRPAVDLDSTQGGAGHDATAVADDSLFAVFSNHVAVSDFDSAELQSATVHLDYRGGQPGYYAEYTTWSEIFSINKSSTLNEFTHVYTLDDFDGMQWQVTSGGSGLYLNITGTADAAIYAELLNAVRFSSHSSNLTDREISVTVSDGTNDSAVATAIVQFETPQANEAPVFDASGIAAIFGQSSVTVTGVTLSDADAGSEPLTGSITAEHGTLALASSNLNNVTGAGTANLSGQGTLNEINAALDDGIVYTPNQQSPPATDKVALTVDDRYGGTDSLIFLFAVAQSGVTLEGTSGKDVIMASPGDDTLTGHDGTDAFVFGPYFGAANSDVITDFSGHGGDGDFLILSGFSVGNFDELLGHLTDVEHGNGVHDTVIAVEQNTITLQNVAALTLSEADFIFHPANIL